MDAYPVQQVQILPSRFYQGISKKLTGESLKMGVLALPFENRIWDSNMANKQCSKCGQVKPLCNFYKRIDRPSGLRSQCKQCIADYDKSHKAKTVGQQRAHRQARTALERGELIPPKNCQECGKESKLDKNHDDYDKPLDVRWLCRACHKNRH